MQIGIDLGASKIESVLLDDNGNEHHRERIEVPKDYKNTLDVIKKIVIELERKAGKELPVGVCHPGIHSIQTGLVKNAPNSFWINGKPLQRDLRKEIGKEIYCENDANCFALSEAIDGSGKHYKIVFGVILGSGVGGGLVIDKRIVNGPNGMVRTAPRLLDADKNEVNYSVGNGSKVRVQFNEYQGENKYGPYTGLDLQAVQVLDLVEYRAEDGAELLDGEEF